MKILGKILAVFYSIILTITIFIISIVIILSNFLKGSFYTKMFETIDINEIDLGDIKIFNESINFKDIIFDSLEEAGIEREVAQSILKNEEIKTVAGNVIEKFINITIEKEYSPIITTDDVEILLNNEEIKSITKKDFSNEEIRKIVDEINKEVELMYKGEQENE